MRIGITSSLRGAMITSGELYAKMTTMVEQRNPIMLATREESRIKQGYLRMLRFLRFVM